VLVTGDEVDHGADLAISCEVDGDVRQSARTSELVFTPAKAIAYLSEIMTLEPGDVISTGTPAGVGPIEPGDVVEIEVEGVGILRNPVVART
jgi:2-keto-4-pentenoate hydratase/2-oxohepta-3-ene-1,7-dioic acid hydratase in catechol pathway